MNVLDYLDKGSIVIDIKPKSKRNIISGIIDHLVENKKITKEDKKEILKVILQREEMGSTAIGNHIALPHGRAKSVKDVLICIGISKEGVDFDSLDQEPVNVIALIISNQKEAGLHLKMLAFLARMLRDKYLVQRLRNVKNEEEVLSLLSKQHQAIK